MKAINTFVKDIRVRIGGIRPNPQIIPVPTNPTNWSLFAQRIPQEHLIWMHIGCHNNECYALRIGQSNSQNTLLKQWFNGPNAIRQILSNRENPPTSLIHTRANEVDFYRQTDVLFSEQHLLLLQTNSLQSTVMDSIMAQIQRHCRPFFSRAHPVDGAALFGSEAFATRLIADVILKRNRVTIESLLPKTQVHRQNQAKTNPSTPQGQTPPSILFSAFVLSLRRIVKDDSQWDDQAFIGQLQGHDPHGNPLVLGPDSERSLVQKWLQLIPRMPKQSEWHYEQTPTGQQADLFLPKVIRNGFGPRVSVIPAKEKPEQYRIVGLHLFRPTKSSPEL